MTAEKIASLLSGKQFYHVGGNCYVNVDKITTVEQGIVYFGRRHLLLNIFGFRNGSKNRSSALSLK